MNMSKEDKSSGTCKIDRKWVREGKRTFSILPPLPRSLVPGEVECWLELMQFYRDDLKWLLSLDHHKFWSHMIYSDRAHDLLISFLKGSPPSYMKSNVLIQEDVKNIFAEVEYLVFLVFLRLSTEKECEGCYLRNFGEIIYNNYLFTVPIILDICLIYGTSNPDLIKKIINNVITSAPDFLDDFQEIFPHFVKVLKTVKEKFSLECVYVVEGKRHFKGDEVQDLILYLCDSVATIQVFLELYPNVCQWLNENEIVQEIVFFYSNVLPEMINYCKRKSESLNEDSLIFNVIENIRVDMLRIVKSIFDFVLNETNDIIKKKRERINEYLILMKVILSEPTFLFDYNLLYSVEFEVKCAVKNCGNVDFVMVDCILREVAKAITKHEDDFAFKNPNVINVKLDSLVYEVKDIFPHLEESFIKQCLNYYNNNTEKVIAAILENLIPPDLDKKKKPQDNLKRNPKHENKISYEILNDREEINKIKERYSLLSVTADDTYDDEYDDTYDDNVDVSVREGEEIGRRPFVVPRVLRTKEETESEEEEEEEEDEEEKGDEGEEENESFRRENFCVRNLSVIGERREQRVRNVVGRGRGHNQRVQVLKNREFKESHKSVLGNHNRKKQASRKYSRGMVPS